MAQKREPRTVPISIFRIKGVNDLGDIKAVGAQVISDFEDYAFIESIEEINNALSEDFPSSIADDESVHRYFAPFSDIEGSVLFVKVVHNKRPKWVLDFFESSIDLPISTIGIVVIYPMVQNETEELFALPFGPLGRYMLKPGMYDGDFGVRTAVKLIKDDKIVQISKRELLGRRLLSHQQIAEGASIAEFDIDLLSDSLSSITASSADESPFSATVKGSRSLSVNAKATVDTVDSVLQYAIDAYSNEIESDSFSFINHHKIITDESALNSLRLHLIREINTNSGRFAASEPMGVSLHALNLILWEDEEIEEMTLECIRSRIGVDFTLDDLGKTVSFYVSDPLIPDPKRHTFEECLFGELSLPGDKLDSELRRALERLNFCSGRLKRSDLLTFCLLDGVWSVCNADYIEDLDDRLGSLGILEPLESLGLHMPVYVHKKSEESKIEDSGDMSSDGFSSEGSYLAKLVDERKNQDKVLLFDRRTTKGGSSAATAIEICDLLSRDGFIHVKRGSRGSQLSHLFCQGASSAVRLIADAKFRSAVNEKIETIIGENNPDDESKKSELFDYFEVKDPFRRTVVFAIISEESSKMKGWPDLTTLGKISLYNTWHRLNSGGIKMKVVRIPVLESK